MCLCVFHPSPHITVHPRHYFSCHFAFPSPLFLCSCRVHTHPLHTRTQLPPGGGQFQEDLIVRQVMRRVVQHLVMEESLLLLEGTDKAHKMLLLGEAGRGGKKGPAGHNNNPWVLW